MDVEDDAFYQDLSKQIALLIMEDDDDGFPMHYPSHAPPQGFHQVPQIVVMPPSLANYEASLSCKRESKGTGVFIPQCYPKKKTKPSNKNISPNNNSNNNSSSSSFKCNVKQGTLIKHSNATIAKTNT
ncbi:hypothetical protein IHE45_12G031700 [Dioscorea alata]|uniref:Uncharacterized protein n=1 Tax=Dioscorea alata TaxID=55571 RepID=A0ACB7V1L4_DIOAL|nr:hypothetical protein IHE45_12G031700 [Dioscorea alata]